MKKEKEILEIIRKGKIETKSLKEKKKEERRSKIY